MDGAVAGTARDENGLQPRRPRSLGVVGRSGDEERRLRGTPDTCARFPIDPRVRLVPACFLCGEDELRTQLRPSGSDLRECLGAVGDEGVRECQPGKCGAVGPRLHLVPALEQLGGGRSRQADISRCGNHLRLVWHVRWSRGEPPGHGVPPLLPGLRIACGLRPDSPRVHHGRQQVEQDPGHAAGPISAFADRRHGRAEWSRSPAPPGRRPQAWRRCRRRAALLPARGSVRPTG